MRLPVPPRSMSLHSAPPCHWLTPAQCEAFQLQGTTAHRLATTHGAWIERLGDDLLLNHQTPELLASLLLAWNQRESSYSFTPKRLFSRSLPLQNTERAAPVLTSGDHTSPLETTVTELGIRYGLDFSAGYAVGLFLDQRANRKVLRDTPPRKLLNTFAYTCSFSVVAALAGAETLSIDLSKKSLDRGRANFELNALNPSLHRFLADDVLEVLPRLIRRGETFDAIILDPPTFSRGSRGRRFRAEDDLPRLLELALQLSAPKARILLSTNCSHLTGSSLERMARMTLKAARQQGSFFYTPPLVDFPPGTQASTLWIQLR